MDSFEFRQFGSSNQDLSWPRQPGLRLMNDLFIRLSVALLIVNIPIECLEERVEKIGDSWASELQE